MQEEEEARRAILNIQEEIRRDLAKEKELQEARNILRQHLQTVNTYKSALILFAIVFHLVKSKFSARIEGIYHRKL